MKEYSKTLSFVKDTMLVISNIERILLSRNYECCIFVEDNILSLESMYSDGDDHPILVLDEVSLSKEVKITLEESKDFFVLSNFFSNLLDSVISHELYCASESIYIDCHKISVEKGGQTFIFNQEDIAKAFYDKSKNTDLSFDFIKR